MSSDDETLRIVYTETPVKEIWSRLSFFESVHNSKEFLEKFDLSKIIKEEAIDSEYYLQDVANNLALTMRMAREYYESAEHVSLLTQPVLFFYGMAALAKGLFTSTHCKKSPSKGHGLDTPKPTKVFGELFTKVLKNGTFPQFHFCYSKEKLFRMKFSMKELLSLIPEIKAEYEKIYDEKSCAIKIVESSGFQGMPFVQVIDPEIKEYKNLAKDLPIFFPEISSVQEIGNGITLFPSDITYKEIYKRAIRTVSGENYLVLPIRKSRKNIFLPEMSAHFMIMYLLSMIARYHPEEWGRIIKGEESGEIYIIKKFLTATTRKFPNLILNKLRNQNFVFLSPQFETKKRLEYGQLEQISEYVERKMAENLRRRL